MDGARRSPTVRLRLLKAELEKAWQEEKGAIQAFHDLVTQVPSCLAEPDGVLKIRLAAARMNEATLVHMQVMKRYVDLVIEQAIADHPTIQ